MLNFKLNLELNMHSLTRTFRCLSSRTLDDQDDASSSGNARSTRSGEVNDPSQRRTHSAPILSVSNPSDLEGPSTSSEGASSDVKKKPSTPMKETLRSLFTKKEKKVEGSSGGSASEYKNDKPLELKSLTDAILKHPVFFKTEGIFRVSANALYLKKAQANPTAFISLLPDLSEEDPRKNIHVLSGLLKYLFKEALDDPDRKIIQQALSSSFSEVNVSALPSPFQCLLSLVVSTLNDQSMNKMGSNNLAVIFNPHIFDISMDKAEIDRQKMALSTFFENHYKSVSSKLTQVLPLDSEEGKLEEACGGQAQESLEAPLTPKVKKKIVFD